MHALKFIIGISLLILPLKITPAHSQAISSQVTSRFTWRQGLGCVGVIGVATYFLWRYGYLSTARTKLTRDSVEVENLKKIANSTRVHFQGQCVPILLEILHSKTITYPERTIAEAILDSPHFTYESLPNYNYEYILKKVCQSQDHNLISLLPSLFDKRQREFEDEIRKEDALKIYYEVEQILSIREFNSIVQKFQNIVTGERLYPENIKFLKEFLGNHWVTYEMIPNYWCVVERIASSKYCDEFLPLLLTKRPATFKYATDKQQALTIYNQLFINAARTGNLSVIRMLCENPIEGFDINVRDVNNGDTALMHVAYDGHFDCVEYLLQRPEIKVDLVSTSSDWSLSRTALGYAALQGHFPIMQLLMRVADPNAYIIACKTKQETLLMHLASRCSTWKEKNESLKLVVELIQSKKKELDINKCDYNQTTALMIATEQGNNECVGFLLTDDTINIEGGKKTVIKGPGGDVAGKLTALEIASRKVEVLEHQITESIMKDIAVQELEEELERYKDIKKQLQDHQSKKRIQSPDDSKREAAIPATRSLTMSKVGNSECPIVTT